MLCEDLHPSESIVGPGSRCYPSCSGMNAAIYDSRELTSYTRANIGSRICKMVARSSALLADASLPFTSLRCIYFYGGRVTRVYCLLRDRCCFTQGFMTKGKWCSSQTTFPSSWEQHKVDASLTALEF